MKSVDHGTSRSANLPSLVRKAARWVRKWVASNRSRINVAWAAVGQAAIWTGKLALTIACEAVIQRALGA